MLKLALKTSINLVILVIIRLQPILFKLHRMYQYYYSNKYSKIFSCKDVYFRSPINYLRGEKYFKIGIKSRFGKEVVLTAWDSYNEDSFTPQVIIGNNCNFGDYLHLTCINKIVIGDGVLTGRWVTITDNSHGLSSEIVDDSLPINRNLYSKGPVIIGNNVWIGDKATVLSGVIIGKNSIIAANSVVTKNIPPNSVAAGNPAKIIKIF